MSESEFTSDTSDLSLASRLSLPPSDSSDIPDSVIDTPKTDQLPAANIRPVMRVTSSRRRNTVTIKLSSESGQSDVDNKIKSHYEISGNVKGINGTSVESDEKQDDEVFDTPTRAAETSNLSGEMNANNDDRIVLPLMKIWDATQRSMSCEDVTNVNYVVRPAPPSTKRSLSCSDLTTANNAASIVPLRETHDTTLRSSSFDNVTDINKTGNTVLPSKDNPDATELCDDVVKTNNDVGTVPALTVKPHTTHNLKFCNDVNDRHKQCRGDYLAQDVSRC